MTVIFHMYPDRPNLWVDPETGEELEVWVEQEQFWHVRDCEVVHVEYVNAEVAQLVVAQPVAPTATPDYPMPELAEHQVKTSPLPDPPAQVDSPDAHASDM
mmetsp:Transcript_3236/g.7110  ORF Transcript_3236/g.7110 Transcript_3236/m.7110 type:complete len:101 (+) Transcript_3236:2110-2412(+)|eukprot:CAMPEP_0202908532 /NCGR_PEP_ID=MMETSP1392-20130828/46348_1 /ASSEMBLY_ACC=CAM_ASM_000868 /TAXON_ID=225041 /ORGANISM="Chlamydomonas chlamydogama, Strain SAG 11-48b" /LENGTH=100 /DNA_ID=CAMNT_0049597923 /DNA_START=331 /DNA_END=633 /DNA_ORIENTATION=-